MKRNRISTFLIFALLFPAACYATDNHPVPAQEKAHKVARPARPQQPSKVVFPTRKKWKNICAYFNGFQPDNYTEILNKRNVEKLLGEVCNKGKGGECETPNISIKDLYKMGMPKDDEEFNYLISEDLIVSASFVDVDNDGANELRLYRTTGSANCMRSYFWKKDASGYYKFSNVKKYDDLYEDGRGCGAHIIFVKYNKSIYTLSINYESKDYWPRIDTVWKGSESELELVCTNNDLAIINE